MTKSKLARIGSKATENMVNYRGGVKPLKLVSFAGNGTVASEQQGANRKKFSVTIENLTAGDLTVALFNPAVEADGWSGANGIDYSLLEGTIDDGGDPATDVLEVTSSRGNYNALKYYLANNPTAILRMRVAAKNSADNTNNELQLQESITRKIYDPFSPQEFNNKEINLSDHFHRNQFQGGFIDVYDGFVVDGNSFVTMRILAGVKVTLDLFFGPTFNQAKALEKYVEENGVLVRKTAI